MMTFPTELAIGCPRCGEVTQHAPQQPLAPLHEWACAQCGVASLAGCGRRLRVVSGRALTMLVQALARDAQRQLWAARGLS